METRRTFEQILAEHPFFQGFTPEQLQVIAECARDTHFKADTYLHREGGPASNFYLLRRGKVAVEADTPSRGLLTIEVLDAGEVVGWSWLFSPYTWHYSARAVEETQAIAFDGLCLRGKAEQDHDLGYALVMKFAEVIMQRLQATRRRLREMYGTK